MRDLLKHSREADVSFDGGDLDCGSGLLLLIREHLDPLPRGGLLEIRSTDPGVDEDLPAWCRLTGNELVSSLKDGSQRSFLVCKGKLAERTAASAGPAKERPRFSPTRALEEPFVPASLPAPAEVPSLPPLAVMGVGSWPRPRWLLSALHERLEGRLDDLAFQETADDAVRLCVASQLRAGVSVVTDGEQRRDSYASFVAARLQNCQLIPLTDLLPLVDDPEEFARELRALDVPAQEVRHPAVFGPLGRKLPIASHELAFVKTLTEKPVKVALPGPYLLTRTMWMECISDRAYASREELARSVVRVLREELHFLLAGGAALVQLDEPVLTEVVFSGSRPGRSFMCGALGAKGDPASELAFAARLVNEVVKGLPRTAVHICRGNWTKDESAALSGDYGPLLGLLGSLEVSALFLELSTPRAGETVVLRDLPKGVKLGLGVVNPKHERIESPDEIARRIEAAVRIFGEERLFLNPDCGFATFADNPVASRETAEKKLAAIVAARDLLAGRRS